MNFEIEHWPDRFGKHTLRRLIIGFIKGWILIALLTLAFFTIYFFTRLSFFRWMTMGFAFVCVFAPFLPILSYFQQDRKNPAYGINKDGFMLNERGWYGCFFFWDEIASIKRYVHPKFGLELHFEFVSYTKAINKEGQDKFRQSLMREYEIQKQPKKISGQLVKGDVTEFIEKFEKYYAEHQQSKKDISSL